MSKILGWAALAAMVILASSAGAAVPAKKKSTAKKSGAAASATSKKKSIATATKKPAATTSTSAARRGKTSARRPAVTWRNRQLQPTPERYKEIQQALAAKGYLHPEDATGAWTPASSEALKKFQTNQNLEASGKVNSLSLIALGLGPKREAAAAPPKPPAGQVPEVPPSGR